MTRFLTFCLDRRIYAVPLQAVEEILPTLPLEPLPALPQFLCGVIFVRGQLVPVIDAAERLRLTRATPAPEDPHLIVLRIRDRPVALVVDEVTDLLPATERRHVLRDEMFDRNGVCEGMLEEDGVLIPILTPERLLARQEGIALDEVRDFPQVSV